MSFKHILLMFVIMLPGIVAIGGSIAMAFYGIQGWGWILFVGMCLAGRSIQINR